MITGQAYNYELKLKIRSVTIAGKNIPVILPGGQRYGIALTFATDEEGSRNMQGIGVKTDPIIIEGTVDISSNGEFRGSWNMNVEAHEIKEERSWQE